MEYEEVEVNSERWLDLKDLLNEEWRDVKGYESYYQVSNYGRVKSFKYKKIRILKASAISTERYFVLTLSKDNIKKHITVHRLVAQTFIPNPNNYPIINHKDCNKHNNHANNLEWCTISYNMLHAIKNGKIDIESFKKKTPHYKGKENPRSRAVFVFDLNDNYIGNFDCIREAKEKLNITPINASTHIVQCCKNLRRKAYGYKWRYADE